MKCNQKGLDLIKKFEGFEPKVYFCPAGYKTIGYGYRVLAKEELLLDRLWEITEEQAERLLHSVVKKLEAKLQMSLQAPLTENQFSALCSFVYNMGHGAFTRSTMFRLLQVEQFRAAADELLRWDKATVNGVKVAMLGLKRRRHAERELFLEEAC